MTSKASPQTKKTADVLERFTDFCRRRSKRQMSEKTLTRYVQVIDVLNRRYGLPLEVVDIGEVERVVTERAKLVSSATFNTEIAVLRRWCQFHGLDPRDREVRDILQFKKVVPKKILNDSDILTPDDVKAIIGFLPSTMLQGVIAVLWDSGCRIGEVLGLDYNDVVRDEHGFTLDIRHSKTQPRKLRMISPDIGLKHFTPFYLAHCGDGPLFQSADGERITPVRVRTVLDLVSPPKDPERVSERRRRRCIGKRVWPMLFRKSASTYWKKSGLLNDPAIRKRLGHAKNSRIFEEWYLTFGDESYKNAELAALGVFKEIEVRIEPKKCWRCGIDIPDTESHCTNCQAPASGKTLLEDVYSASDIREELDAMKTALRLVIEVIEQDPKVKERMKALLVKGVALYEGEELHEEGIILSYKGKSVE